ncbi:DUF6544 family protein [Gorillibacterium sp. CAU 1737]|uniref:DUF6544 family protein n=1 Tax=Gorillibacterium sp. CAU 1737 TaxID=3140362 RepID=UPI0032616FF5
MILTLVVIAILVGATLTFFHLPYSKTKSKFHLLAEERLSTSSPLEGVFTASDWESLPPSVRTYFESSGFTGQPKMSSMKAEFRDVPFLLSGKSLTIDYTQYNFLQPIERIAWIDTSLAGVPFEGLDTFLAGKGGMKGVLGKLFPLFDQHSQELDQASLVTYLSEVLLFPSAALESGIVWNPIDDTQVKATLSAYGLSVSGWFQFREGGESVSFTTDDRYVVESDGTSRQVRWSALMDNFKVVDGIRQPTRMRAVWHEKSGDVVYFDSDNLTLHYR